MNSHYRCVVAVSLSLIVYEIERDIGR